MAMRLLQVPRLSQHFVPTLRSAPVDAQADSHRLLLRAGLVRQSSAGIYSLLPLGLRVVDKIVHIIDEEMHAIGCHKLSMPLLLNSQLLKITGRWDSTGKELIRLKDRKQTEMCLAPTHEELITHLVANDITSYRQLPLRLYQIDRKYRDEFRPRFGLLRGREFIMKDLYSFDLTQQEAFATYDQVSDAYERILRRTGFTNDHQPDYIRVEADSGNIGGSRSHEFQVLTERVGEDTVMVCQCGQYCTNVERTVSAPPPTFQNFPNAELHVSSFIATLATKDHPTLKHRPKQHEQQQQQQHETHQICVIVATPVDRQANIIKVKAHLDATDLRPVSEGDEQISHPENTLLFVDSSVQNAEKLQALASRAKLGTQVGQFLLSKEGDRCVQEGIIPSCTGGPLSSKKGLELAHIFYLGTKYSETLSARFTDERGQNHTMEMGCFGIGVSRMFQAIIERHNDAEGIVWPLSVAPYRVCIVPLSPKFHDESVELSRRLQQQQSISDLLFGEVVVDDRRDVLPGPKMKDATLLGIPFVILLGKSFQEDGRFEVQIRLENRHGTDTEKHFLTEPELIQFFREKQQSFVEQLNTIRRFSRLAPPISST